MFIPKLDDEPEVAPVIVHISDVTEQLSEKLGSGVFTDALQFEVAVFTKISAAQIIVGATVSATVTVKEQIATLPIGSNAL